MSIVFYDRSGTNIQWKGALLSAARWTLRLVVTTPSPLSPTPAKASQSWSIMAQVKPQGCCKVHTACSTPRSAFRDSDSGVVSALRSAPERGWFELWSSIRIITSESHLVHRSANLLQPPAIMCALQLVPCTLQLSRVLTSVSFLALALLLTPDRLIISPYGLLTFLATHSDTSD